MVWIFLSVVLVCAILFPGFRKVLFGLAALCVAFIVVMAVT